ncbi:hypothetical protein Salat_2423800, partial [Sesamum alatum]
MESTLCAYAYVDKSLLFVHHGLTQILTVVPEVVLVMGERIVVFSSGLIHPCVVGQMTLYLVFLNRLNNQDKQLKEYRQKLRVLEARDDDMMLYRLCGIVGSVITLVLLILYVRATI